MNNLVKDKNAFFRFVIITVLVVSFFANATSAEADEGGPPLPIHPGWTEGTGTYFELPDSPYLPITLNSSVAVTLTLSSVPEVVEVTTEADPEAGSAF